MPNAVVSGRAYRQSAAGTTQCSTASFSGNYGYLLTGVAFSNGLGLLYTDAGSATTDGKGSISAASMLNVNGTTLSNSGSGSYSVSADCSGTARVSNQNGTANYAIAVVSDGAAVLFMSTDPGYTVGGTAEPQFVAPQSAVVNGASFQAQLSPGSLFSVFGNNLSRQSASASTIPLPTSLANTQLLVDGKPVPLLFVGNGQINAQMPFEAAVGRPVSITVTNSGQAGNAVGLSVQQTGPGLFTTGGRAIVQNSDGSLNSDSKPARPGDVVVVYLTGGGAVNPSGTLVTGSLSPNGASPVNAAYTVTIGGSQVQASYLGLTPGFVGLYQLNFTVPNLPPGRYPIVVTAGGVSSNAPLISIGQ
jgi:uncharacterized protein (TIGR03437 family)